MQFQIVCWCGSDSFRICQKVSDLVSPVLCKVSDWFSKFQNMLGYVTLASEIVALISETA